MTLLIALANERFALSISDRRLTRDGVPCDDEYNKVAMWDLNDARAAVSFTGLAQLPPFDTHTWLLEAMTEASRPEGLLMPALERLEALATKKIDDLHIAEDKSTRSCGSDKPPTTTRRKERSTTGGYRTFCSSTRRVRVTTGPSRSAHTTQSTSRTSTGASSLEPAAASR